MKTIKLLFIGIFLLSIISSCEDVMDRTPLDLIADEDVFKNEGLATAYVINLYSRLPHSPFNAQQTHFSDESSTSAGTGGFSMSRSSDAAGYWDYSYIRECNEFIEQIRESPLDISIREQLEGEVRFLRAFSYFKKAKRYGGVPLVDIVIDPFEDIDPKYTYRSTEEDIFNFIDSELTQVLNMLTTNAHPKGRANRQTAAALHARAMLWAGSIAKYGNVQLDGLVGIPAARANEFYQKASASSDLVIQSNNYSLYNPVQDDKSENYRRIFIDENHDEIIYELVYDGVNRGHGWDSYQGPMPFTARGSARNPTLDFILGYENIDGADEQPIFGPEHLYEKATDPFINKDPRLFATVFFDNDVWAGDQRVRTYEGIDPSPTPDPSAIISNPEIGYMGMPSTGLAARFSIEGNNTSTGFVIQKYIDQTQLLLGDNQSSTNWIIFRLAEMYLIKAEAEFELGNLQTAANALNSTRERAGIMLVDENSINLDRVRNERRSELAYENFRYWDLRRWRISEEVLNHWFRGLRIIYHFETAQYYFLDDITENSSRTFNPEYYYNPITDNRINNNPDLVENPRY